MTKRWSALLRWAAIGTVSLSIAGLAACAVLNWAGAGDVERELERIRAAGEPVSVRDIVPPEIPADRNGAPRLMAAMARSDCGALALFLGTSRDHHDGRRVTSLAYEAYESMALAALADLERAAPARYAIADCRIVHPRCIDHSQRTNR